MGVPPMQGVIGLIVRIMIRGLHNVSGLVSADSSKPPMRTDLMMSHWRRLEVLIAAVCLSSLETWATALTKTTEGARWGLQCCANVF